jgi:molybdopterin-containing oxidoreductase family membrane subunit
MHNSKLVKFLRGCFHLVIKGNAAYYAWMGFLLLLIIIGVGAYVRQMQYGLITTNMRDSVSWAFYIGNFTFLVGVAAAAVVLVIPAYIYHWKPIKEIVILGELLAISSIIMCLLFVTVDIGRPERVWHMLPFIGKLHFPSSLLAWDFIVLNLYLVLNVVIVAYILYKSFSNEEHNKKFIIPLVFFAIPMAVSIHTVTAFLYNGLSARPFWNSAILAPKFLCSAFCSGPAILLILLQILRKTSNLEIKDEGIWKIAELMAYAAFINLFLFGAEVFKEYYSGTHHLLYHQYMFWGIGEHKAIVPFAWLSLFCNITAFLLFMIPATRKNFYTLNIGCLLIYSGVYIEKGMTLIIPGFTPDTLGEIYEYTPSLNEVLIAAGIFSVGFLVYTLMVKIAIPIIMGKFHVDQPVVSSRTHV